MKCRVRKRGLDEPDGDLCHRDHLRSVIEITYFCDAMAECSLIATRGLPKHSLILRVSRQGQ